MLFSSWVVIALLCFCGLVSGSEFQRVGPCNVKTTEMSFNCSSRKLSEVPSEIWDNATALDLSQNHLNLSMSKNLRALDRFNHLVLLNLSGNVLTRLEKDSFRGLPSLLVLDLSRCQLQSIQAEAFRVFQHLKRLFLGNNRLQNLPPSTLKDLRTLTSPDLYENCNLRSSPNLIKEVQSVPGLENTSKEMVDEDSMERIRRQSLTENYNEMAESRNNSSETRKPETSDIHGWSYLLGALGTIIAISVLIVVVVKCNIFQRYLASYRHALLSEADTTSQCDPAALEVGFSGHGTVRRDPEFMPPGEMYDDDGFIEDNYIQASERERAEAEVGEDEFEEDDIQFSIG